MNLSTGYESRATSPVNLSGIYLPYGAMKFPNSLTVPGRPSMCGYHPENGGRFSIILSDLIADDAPSKAKTVYFIFFNLIFL